MNYSENDFSSSADTENILCDIMRTDASNLHSKVTYTENTTRLLQQGPPPNGQGPPPNGGGAGGLTTTAGIAITGGVIFNGLAAGN